MVKSRLASKLSKNNEVVEVVYMLSVMVVVAGCRCRCWGIANYSSILMLEDK